MWKIFWFSMKIASYIGTEKKFGNRYQYRILWCCDTRLATHKCNDHTSIHMRWRYTCIRACKYSIWIQSAVDRPLHRFILKPNTELFFGSYVCNEKISRNIEFYDYMTTLEIAGRCWQKPYEFVKTCSNMFYFTHLL